MLGRRAQSNARQAAGDGEDDFVDLRVVEKLQDDVERVSLIFRTVCVGADRDTDAERLGFAHQPGVGFEILLFRLDRVFAIEKSSADFDRQTARVAEREQAVLVLIEPLLNRPAARVRGRVEVPDDVRRELLQVVEQLGHVEFPQFVGPDHVVQMLELRVVERPGPVRALLGMVDRDEVHRADQTVGPHRFDDILCVRPGARIVIDLGPDREAHAAAQRLGNGGGVPAVDARGFGGSEDVAGVGELERSPQGVDGAGILEREIVDVVGHHQEARRVTPARVKKPQEKHPRRIRDRTFLGKGPVLPFRVAVNVGDGRNARIAQERPPMCVAQECIEDRHVAKVGASGGRYPL